MFADEKPMKEINLYGKVRRDVMNGSVPVHKCKANSKNRWNILAACTVKGYIKHNVEYLIIDECTDASIKSSNLHLSLFTVFFRSAFPPLQLLVCFLLFL